MKLKFLFAAIFICLVNFELLAQNGKPDSFAKPIIGGYISNRAESVNTYWIEGKGAVIVVDLQRSLSKAREALAAVKKLNKPVAAILITHPHPDHIAGIALFKEEFPNADVYASQLTVDEMKSDSHKWIAFTKKLYGDDYPNEVVLPNKILQTSGTLNLAGMQIEYAELGASESSAATVFYVPAAQILFVGDLVIHQMIPFLLEERSGVWLRQLALIPAQFPNAKLIYPGHGFPGGTKALLDEQTIYLKDVRVLAEKEIKAGNWNGKNLSDAAKKRIVTAIEAKYPQYIEAAAVPDILKANADAVAKELTNVAKKDRGNK